MAFIIRKGNIDDMDAVYKLIHELAVFENEPNAVAISVDDLKKDGFNEQPAFETFVAEKAGAIVGAALFYNRYSTWQGKAVHLEDLIVNHAHRGKGIGLALYKKVMETAFNMKVNRVEWEVMDWNTGAIDFYLSTGARMIENWNLCQMDRKGLKLFLKK